MQNILNTLKTNSKKGFTLVEMIIVIVIIAILAAIAIPAMKGYIEDANEATAIANCRTALTASEATVPLMEATDALSAEAEFTAEMTNLLGAYTSSGTTTEVVAGQYTSTGTFADGELVVTYTVGEGTDEITWTQDGITAYWEEGMSAPEIGTPTP